MCFDDGGNHYNNRFGNGICRFQWKGEDVFSVLTVSATFVEIPVKPLGL